MWRGSDGKAKAFTSNANWKNSDRWVSTDLNSNVGEAGATGVYNSTLKNENDSEHIMDVGNPSIVYGNNTANPIIGYGVESGAIEIAQKK